MFEHCHGKAFDFSSMEARRCIVIFPFFMFRFSYALFLTVLSYRKMSSFIRIKTIMVPWFIAGLDFKLCYFMTLLLFFFLTFQWKRFCKISNNVKHFNLCLNLNFDWSNITILVLITESCVGASHGRSWHDRQSYNRIRENSCFWHSHIK